MFYFLHTEEKCYLLLFLMLSNAFHLVYLVFVFVVSAWPFNVVSYATHGQTPKYLIPFHSVFYKCLLGVVFWEPPGLTCGPFLKILLPEG